MSYITINTIEIAGFDSAIKALHLPYSVTAEIDLDCDKSNIIVSDDVDTDNPTIHTEIMTNSKVNISYKDVTLLKALVKRGDEHAKVLRGIIVYALIDAPIHFWWDMETYTIGHQRLCSESTQNTECRGLSGKELLDIKDNIPFGRQVRKIDFFSYQCLRHIYKQRYNHRNHQWKEFCQWIESLPLSEELITIGLEDIKKEE